MKTICALITSPLRSTIAVIRISGTQTRKCLQELGVFLELIPQRSFFHKIRFNNSNEIIDEALITYFQAPKSYTGEDVAEISIHGSQFIIKKIFQKLLTIENVDLATGGEFSKRAFLNGKMDLIQAEAIPDLIASETEAQHRQAMQQLQGNLGRIYDDWRNKLIEISAFVEALIDFPEDDLPSDVIDNIIKQINFLKNEISLHLNDNFVGEKIKNGLSLTILGAPNSGKSSLLNFLAKSDVAIVSEVAGTTRDIINIHLEISGIPIIISDTAGIRDTIDNIESEGIKRAIAKAKNSDIVLYLIDVSNPIIHLDLIDNNTILIFNKVDKVSDFDINKFLIANKIDKNILCCVISIKNQININRFFDILKKKLEILIPNLGFPVLTQERYRLSLQNCLNSLENFNLNNNIEICAEDLRVCLMEISKINGKINIDNILDVIFSNFCIGK